MLTNIFLLSMWWAAAWWLILMPRSTYKTHAGGTIRTSRFGTWCA